MKKLKYKIIYIAQYALFISGVFFCVGVACLMAKEIENKDFLKHEYITSGWNQTMNTEEKKVEKYPEKRKITPETVRLTINEYYIPQFSELLDKGVDCWEWINKLDDPYLNRYKVDIKVDPEDERLKLFWKRSF